MRKTTKANVSGWLAMALPALLPMSAFGEPLMLDAQPAASTAAPQVVAEAPAPAPAVVPAPASAPIPAPAPAPASSPAVIAPNPMVAPGLTGGKILILPFQADNPNDATPWLGKSIQESMMADLTVAAPDRVKVTDQTAASPDAAVALGKQENARFVIAGGFATVGGELRITGKVLDVDTGKSVAGLKVTGEPGQIFHMEDALALQVRAQVLGQQVGPMQPPPADQQQQPVQAQPAPSAAQDAGTYAQQPAEQPYTSPYAIAPAPVVYGADVTPDYYPTYVGGYDPYYYPAGYAYSPYYCDYGYYGGCYPFGLGFGFYFGNNFGFRSHRGFDRDHFGREFGGNERGVRTGVARGSLGVGRSSLGVGTRTGVRTSNFRAGVSASPGFARSAARVSSPSIRSSAAFRGSSSFGRAASTGGFHAGSSFASHGSFGGGFSHGGGGGHIGGGGGHAGGGHR